MKRNVWVGKDLKDDVPPPAMGRDNESVFFPLSFIIPVFGYSEL